MFHPYPDGKCLGCHMDSLIIEKGKSIPGTVTQGQDDMFTGNLFSFSFSGQAKSHQMSVPDYQVI